MAAKDSSFDVVSEVDMQEIDNAWQQTKKELIQRYDLKDCGAKLELDKSTGVFTLTAPSEFVASQVQDVLNTKLVRRNIDLKALSWGDPQGASGMTIRILGKIVSGIDKEIAGQINKDIRALKLKNVKVAIEGEKLRLSCPSKDALQDVIAFLKEKDYGLPLQYRNYR
ncbi:MAG: YajQ family cyclic di-GMP-binding protein [Coriobacteriia bacterium]|nr:YajQ family cyclic di-GMP-binding protein [Coriobacteriia bacterium]